MNPEDPLAEYYVATALRMTGQNNIAISLLVERLSRESHSPALLWFILGQAYYDRRSYKESVTAFEQTQDLFNSGDTSLLLLSQEPESLIHNNLAQAYLGMQRCVAAELLFRRLAESNHTADYTNWITEAVTCQTPTPTPTHWMISLQD
jgi:tetratricopeptide (TPR) repeat protein